MNIFNYSNYSIPKSDIWQGRVDGLNPEAMRWHQVIEIVDLRLSDDFNQSVVFLGFCCDEGVRRNHGREGAKEAPDYLRNVMANLPVHFSDQLLLKDAGDIICEGDNLEQAQFVLSEAVSKIIEGGGFPIILGGGHEITYGHYNGLRKIAKTEKIGVINIDAHLDIRPTREGKGNSGTGFFQIAEDCENENLDFRYLAIGIQEISNTQSLFKYAFSKDVSVIYAHEIKSENIKNINAVIKMFSEEVDHVYLTIDLDAFAAPYAPGVSSLAFNGIIPDEAFFSFFSTIINLQNLRSIDIAELNPKYDLDYRTAKLASSLLFFCLK